MPIGVIIDAIAVILGGIFGNLLGNRLSEELKTKLSLVMGISAFAMGISSIALVENLPAVILALILGTLIGIGIKLDLRIRQGAGLMSKGFAKVLKSDPAKTSSDDYTMTLITIIVLFCASGTGIYGSLVSGISGDHSMLLAKSILDLTTATIYGCSLGLIVSFIAIPQFIIFLSLFLLAKVIYPLTTPTMINDFKCAGGILLFATGFRMIKVKEIPVAEMIPSMVLVMPISWAWVNIIMPLLK